MHDESGGEPAGHLLAVARAHGFEASKTQLARWHRAGLLPRPTQHGLGRGQGTESVYPPGTAALLLDLCAIRKRERRLIHIGWHLWWTGHNSLTGEVRGFLHRQAAKYERRLKRLARGGELTESGWKFVDDAEKSRSGGKFLGQIRRRVGKRRLGTLMAFSVEALSGGFEDYSGADDAAVFAAALGLPEAGRLPDDLLWVRDAAAVREVSRVIHPAAFREALKRTTDEDLIRARGELRALLASSQIVGLGLGTAAKEIDAWQPWGQVALMLVWLVWRTKSGSPPPGAEAKQGGRRESR